MRRRKSIVRVLIDYALLIIFGNRRFARHRAKKKERMEAADAVARREMDVPIRGEGRVPKLLPDDNMGNTAPAIFAAACGRSRFAGGSRHRFGGTG